MISELRSEAMECTFSTLNASTRECPQCFWEHRSATEYSITVLGVQLGRAGGVTFYDATKILHEHEVWDKFGTWKCSVGHTGPYECIGADKCKYCKTPQYEIFRIQNLKEPIKDVEVIEPEFSE